MQETAAGGLHEGIPCGGAECLQSRGRLGACGPGSRMTGWLVRGTWRRGRLASGVVLLVGTGFLAECLALVQDAQRLLGERVFGTGRGGAGGRRLRRPL